jgi:hypothetical protein
MLVVLLLIPKAIVATADGEPSSEIDLEVLAEIGATARVAGAPRQ